MAGPSVNVVLRLDSSKVKEDSEKAKSILTTSIGPTVDVFNVAEKAAQAFGKALEFGGKALVFLTERTGAVQSLTETLSDTRKAIGEAADRSGALRTATEAIEEAARSLAEFFRSDEGRTAVNAFFGLIAAGAANAIDAVNGALKAVQDLRWWMAGQGLIKGPMVLPLDGETPQQAALTQLADQLRAAGDTSREGSGVRDRGTFRDDEAIKAARDRAAALKKAEEERVKSSYEMMDSAVAQFRAIAKAEEEERKKKFQADMAALDHQRNIAELTRQVDEGKTETAIRNAERRAELEEKNLAAQKARDERAAQAAESSAATLTGLANMATQGVASAITAGAAAIATGGDLGAAIASAMGGAVAALGATLIATGTGVLAGIALGNVIPGLKALFPDWGAPAAAAAIGVGTLLVGGGSYLQSLVAGGSSAGSTGSPNARTPAAGAGRATGFSGTPEGFAGASLAPVTTVLNYNFNGPMGGSPRRIAREIRDLSTVGDTLLPGYRSPGGR